MPDYAEQLGLSRVLVNLIGQDLAAVTAMKLAPVELVQVMRDGETPILLVLEALLPRTAQQQAEVFWSRQIPAMIAKDYEDEQHLFRFLVQDHSGS